MNNDLMPGFVFGEEAAKYLKTTERKISLYRRYGLLKWARFGKSFVYRKQWLDQFAEEWSGYDLSNEEAVKLAVNGKRWKEQHAQR